MIRKITYLFLSGLFSFTLVACSDDDNEKTIPQTDSDAQFIGQAVGNFSADEWYPGGKLGTTENVGSASYEDETPATTNLGLSDAFTHGEQMFERNYTISTAPFKGLGPASVRSSCIDCHPGYGHGQRQTTWQSGYGNGYLLVVYHPVSEGSNDGPYISEVTGMPQGQAIAPFKAPIPDQAVNLTWKKVTAMESGVPMQFSDGEKYELIYPEVTIKPEDFNTLPKPENIACRLEVTIGIYGTGLIDAIPEDSIKAQYQREAAYFASKGLNPADYLNPSFWDASANTWAKSAYYGKFADGYLADGTRVNAGSYDRPKRFTYAMTRASLQDGAGANAIWNITNVSRDDRPYLYTTQAWADAMSQDADVIDYIQRTGANENSYLHPYYADGTNEGIANAVAGLLNPKTNQFNNEWYNFKPEMSNDDYYDFMVWHRGLAVPRARDLNDPDVQLGKKLFTEMGCASCHRPKWKTGDDNYWVSANIGNRPLPRYQNQTIYPYSDFIQHRMYMINDIHGTWCRTTPLWGRGLSLTNTGAEERLHDCRARNEIEAIMWHAYSKKSDAYNSAMKFYELKKEERDAVVKFIRSI